MTLVETTRQIAKIGKIGILYLPIFCESTFRTLLIELLKCFSQSCRYLKLRKLRLTIYIGYGCVEF
ncbi:hypothetical protein OUZ56_029838 [Daphnia magna]|uniref:Uncharacterized protein n=1 Tax=Daphnia magna TaxID=35525 RepID=A0ABR0B7Z5_9CRUS|nr:hypothetical protein OUZ56_029838 [Daphnia magna]